ncbi:MAG: type IV secretion system DNA-binding domain-containing protein [Candidatus Thiodiazotropha endolucinida]|nr:type IV secretion system DNA-binding domain-containing protein [Candidatus Thiodiazotropha taylori]MCW4262267.1 type IV secretion system DNA-binding domain-containing protein [Candidatus Thiodiazotropha endolucinida]
MFSRIDLAPSVKRNNWPGIIAVFLISFIALTAFALLVFKSLAWQSASLSQYFYILLNPSIVDAPLSEFIELYGYSILIFGIPLGIAAFFASMLYVPGGRDAYTHIEGTQRYDFKEAIKVGSQLLQQEIAEDDIGERLRIHPLIPYPFLYERYNYLITGAPRSGKTTIMVSLMDQAIERGDKVVFFDPAKREATEMFYRSENTLLLAPWDERSKSWAISKDCLTDIEAEAVAEKFIPMSGKDEMWPRAARLVTTGLIIYLQNTRGTKWGWEHLDACFSYPIEKLEQVFDEHYPFVSTFIEEESVTTQGILINIKSFVSFIRYFAKAWKKSWINGISLKAWVRDQDTEKNVLIVQTHPDFKTLSTAMNQLALSFVADTYLTLGGSLTRRLWFNIDELPSFRHENLLNYISILPAKGAVFLFIYQTPHILHKNFEEWEIDGLDDMTTTTVTLRNSGKKSSKAIAEGFGTRKVSYTKYTRNGGTVTASTEEDDVPLVQPNEIASLPPASVKKGITGFLEISGIGALFKLNWPIDTSRPQIVAEDYIEADWVKPALKIEVKAEEIRNKLTGQEQPDEENESVSTPHKQEHSEKINSSNKVEIELIENESDQQTNLNPDALAAAEGAEEAVETFMPGAGAGFLAGGIEAISMAELASDLLSDDAPEGDLIHHKKKKQQQKR